ncbi:ATP-binding protein [Mesorhizobium sp. M0895]|uniref:YobI family P-loop NTPase n=1 Tax=Mesorhizobium sp. M0895 TaxID=2957019 RepID=UPI003334CFA9
MRQIIARLVDLLCRSNDAVDVQSKFIDLAPTEKADKAGVYSDALLYATGNPRVSNIALTGPYGSGKSSIIRAFLKKYRHPILQISLAAFLPEATATGGAVSKQEIERSILQQMLYGADANQLPLSRFKRIKSPSRWSIFLSLYVILGVVACWHLFKKRDDVISGSFFLPLSISNWPNFLWFVVGASFLWLTVYHFYKVSFGLSLKSISLKDIEITPVAASQESILNRHLDEIIYFFQSTKYDLVIIEDLDRFNNPEIFVTLREINSIVNENAGVKRKIRFLYALRDDMFVNTDRTKFFEFIIPVIPIINSSNSIDKVLEQGKRLSLDDRLDRQFLREVSRYLNDLRLIQNIFNEYAIYVANLENDGDNMLDANKLLAVLIYKNVFPKDFESLHRGEGNLASILARHDEFIASGEAEYRTIIERIEHEIDVAELQVPANLLDLRRIYAMALVEKLPAQASHIVQNGQILIEISTLARSENFDQIISSQTITYRNINGYHQNINISSLQSEVDSLRTFGQRKEEVEQRAAEFRSSASKRLRALRAKSATLRSAKFNEVVRLNAAKLSDIFDAFRDNSELARFLIFEGHLDDTYYQYTSLFHAGRLSPNDNKYLIQIRGFINPDPDFPIDNAKEVVAAMRDGDFRQHFVLNVKLVDCLLGDEAAYSGQVAKMFEYLASEFENCDAFFTSYYAAGTEVPKLVARLRAAWPGFIPAVLANLGHLTHMGQIIAYLPEPALKALPAAYSEISPFVSANLAQILALGIDFDPSRLKALGIELEDLSSIEGFPGIARFLFEEGFYKLTVENLEFIFRAVLGISDLEPLRTQHYTTVIGIGNAVLNSRIERNFVDYFKNVVLRLEGNSRESVAAILSIVAREDADFDDLNAFLSRQSAIIPSLNDVPTRLHPLVFHLSRVAASWENCLAFIGSAMFDAAILTGFLETEAALAALPQQAIPDNDKATVLRQFLINDDALQDAAYQKYVQRLPRTFTKFPSNLGPGKLRILIEEARVKFNKDNFDELQEKIELKILFVVKNIDLYLKEEATFALEDDFRELLLGEDIGDTRKLAIIRSMDLTLLSGLPARAGKVGAILERTGADVSALDAEAARAVILNSAPIRVQISLFNKCQKVLGDGGVREILAALPEPFSEIKTGYYTPRIDKTDINIELVKWLDERNIISSWGDTLFGDAIRVNLYRRDASS